MPALKPLLTDTYRPESMLSALKMMREEYGSAEQYAINQCGLTPEQITQLRSNLIETTSS